MKQLWNDITTVADDIGVEVTARRPQLGRWTATNEPSFMLDVKGSPERVRAYAGKLGLAMRAQESTLIADHAGTGTTTFAFPIGATAAEIQRLGEILTEHDIG